MIGPHAVTHAIKDAAAAPAVAAVATASQANIQADHAIGPALATCMLEIERRAIAGTATLLILLLNCFKEGRRFLDLDSLSMWVYPMDLTSCII